MTAVVTPTPAPLSSSDIDTFEQQGTALQTAIDAIVSGEDAVRDQTDAARLALNRAMRAVAVLRRTGDPTVIGPINSVGAVYQRHRSLAAALDALEGSLGTFDDIARDLRTTQPSVVAALRNTLPPASVTVTLASPIAVGATGQASASAKDANGGVMIRTFTWASSDATLATVDAAGLVTGVAAGTVTITATSNDGVAGTASVTIQ